MSVRRLLAVLGLGGHLVLAEGLAVRCWLCKKSCDVKSSVKLGVRFLGWDILEL